MKDIDQMHSGNRLACIEARIVPAWMRFDIFSASEPRARASPCICVQSSYTIAGFTPEIPYRGPTILARGQIS